jgi:hypothetical protein
MVAGEGDVGGGVEVLGSDFQGEAGEGEERVDDWGDGTASFDYERSILGRSGVSE